MVNLFKIRKAFLERKLAKQEIKTLRFNAKQRKVKQIEKLNEEIAQQKKKRILTPLQKQKRAKIKKNARKVVKLLKKGVKDISKPKKRKGGKKKGSSLDGFFD